MALLLKPVPPARGVRWVTDALRLFARRPLGFTMLFVLFLVGAMFLALVPVVGGLLQMAVLPLLSLGFMVASQSALLGGGVRPDAFVEPLQGSPARRKTLLVLCAAYGVAAMLILWLADAVSGGVMAELFDAMGQPEVPAERARELLADERLLSAVLLTSALGTLLSMVFWHAPALVHWGGQGAAQSLFSSALAVWRSKWAFVAYGLAWLVLTTVIVGSLTLLLGLLGGRAAMPLLALPAGLFLSTVFYISLIFSFHDSFGGAPTMAAAEPGQPTP